MNKDQQYNKKGITPEKIIAFIERRAKVPRAVVASNFGVSERTISYWSGEILDYVKQSDAYKQVAPRLVEMIPRAFDVYDRRLEEPGAMVNGAPDLTAAKDILRMAGIFVDRLESKDTTHATNDNELKDRLAGLLESELGEDDSTSESGSDSDSSGTGTPEDRGAEPILPPDPTAT
jgi:hypothetical protein